MPITADEGRVVAVVNGEIYDHKETRQRLEKAGRRFATYSDSEVVPQLYAESGPDIAPHLSGMFAFAVWDRREERLVLGRDRFGMKPLYLAQKDGLWMFASEVKALLATGKIERKIDQRALLDVLTAGYPMPPRSIVEGVRALPPAMQMTLTKSQTSTTQYWHMPYGRRGETGLAKRTRYDDAVEEVRQTFDDVVKAHLMADVEVGSYLSGGLDSVSVAARAKALGSGQLRTYSLVFPGPEKGFDESEHSRIAAAAIGSRHQEVPLEGITEADYVGTIRAMESPQVHTVAFCLYRLARAVKEDGLKVVLSGEGADETFAGYGVFRLSKLRRTPIGQWMGLRRLATRYALKNRQPELSRSLDRWWGHEKALEKRYGVVPPWVEQWWLLGDAATPLLGRSLEMPESVPGLDLATITDPLQRELAFEQRTRLDGWVLPLGDRLSMAHGIEVFVVSAAAEELVRMVLADPQYGYHVKPENVIGVTTLLRDRATGALTTARKRIAEGCYLPGDLVDHELTHTLWAPLPWYEGKQAAIHTYIHPWKRPVLVAGDTPASDGPMLLRAVDVEKGALRLFVSRKDSYHANIHALQRHHAAAQLEHGVAVTADRNWLVVTPDEIR